MAAEFGVNYTISAQAARPIAIQSITPIGIAGTATGVQNGLYFYGSVTAAKEALKEAGSIGSIVRAINAIYDQVVETPIILSVFTEGANSGITTTAARAAVQAFVDSKTQFGYRPNILIAPEYSHIYAVADDLKGAAERQKGIAIVDLEATSEEGVWQELEDKNLSGKRILFANPFVKVWDAVANAYTYAPQSAFLAGLIARTDGEKEYGWADSYSNRTINGIYGTQRPIEFVHGQTCEADRLRTAHISTIIREEGWRAWGGETTDIDTIWQDLARVRIFDRISEACQKGVFFAIDRRADELLYAKLSVEELLRALKGSKVLVGYDVTWSATKNTQANITAGKFYLDIKMQNNPIVKQLNLDFIYSDAWSADLLASIS
jgi:phage tail sheath protein FI